MAEFAEDLAKAGNRRNWVSLVPYGLNEQHPNNYLDILDSMWENRDSLGYAFRILNDGCCDGCSLGTCGMHDWTMKGIHLCSVRLQLLRLNTMPAMDASLPASRPMWAGPRMDCRGSPCAATTSAGAHGTISSANAASNGGWGMRYSR